MKENLTNFRDVIDVEKAIRESKNSRYRKMPTWAVNIIKSIIKQRELNEVHNSACDKIGLDYVNGALDFMNVKIEIHNPENIPQTGRFVFAANHSQGGIDALAFLSSIGRFFPNVVSPSNQLFMYIPNLHPLIVGVNVFGKNSKEVAAAVNSAFESDAQIMIFPAGEVSRKIKGTISDPEWQKAFITKSIQSKRDIIPTYISGQNSALFYFVSNFRKKLGIKTYIETMMLPREMLRHKNNTFHIFFGKPISWEFFDKTKSHNEWAQYVRNEVYKLKIK